MQCRYQLWGNGINNVLSPSLRGLSSLNPVCPKPKPENRGARLPRRDFFFWPSTDPLCEVPRSLGASWERQVLYHHCRNSSESQCQESGLRRDVKSSPEMQSSVWWARCCCCWGKWGRGACGDTLSPSRAAVPKQKEPSLCFALWPLMLADVLKTFSSPSGEVLQEGTSGRQLVGTSHARQCWGRAGEPRVSQKNAWRATPVGVSLDLRLSLCCNVSLRTKGQELVSSNFSASLWPHDAA